MSLETSLPASDCYPFSFITKAFQQSEWSKETVKNSVEALKEMNVDVTSLIKKIDISMFYDKSKITFFEEVIQMIHLFFDRDVSGEAYLHLYLVVSLLILPMLLADEKDGLLIVQTQLCEYLDIFLARLQTEFVGLLGSDFCNLMCFSNIIKEISTLNRLLVTSINMSLTEQVVKVMVGDVKSLAAEKNSQMSDVIYSSIIIGLNAFNGDNLDTGLKESPKLHSIIEDFVEKLLKLCILMADDVGLIPESMGAENSQKTTYNLCFRIFKILVKISWKFCPMHRYHCQLGSQVSFLGISKEIHNLSLNDFSERDHGVSKESFRNWWMHSATLQTFITVLSEITALSAHLD